MSSAVSFVRSMPEPARNAGHSIRLPDDPARHGAANSWGVMSVDEEHGYVLIPTGSASPDFYGGKRLGSNRFANSLLAIDASSGKLVWNQQLVHHDLWDFDLAAQPALADIELQGIPVPGVIQATKTGMLYVFDRVKGQPLFPITEKPVPASKVPGEEASPTQPFSSLPSLVSQRRLNPEDAWGITFWDRGKCRDLIASHRNEGIFTPPDTHGTILSPGYIGGVNWGGIAVDESRQRVFAAVNHLPMVVTLMPAANHGATGASRTTTRILTSRVNRARRTQCGASHCCPHGACRARHRPGAPS